MSNTDWKLASNPTAALSQIDARLRAAGISAPRAEAHQILTAVVARPLVMVDALTPAQLETITSYVQARCTGMPLQHVLGEMAFCHLHLRSDARALVVRPETELLASWAIEELRRWPSHLRQAIDVGTGSGNLALALATAVPAAAVLAFDTSEQALALAAENSRRYRSEIAAMNADITLVRTDICTTKLGGPASCVVANPPYLPRDEEALAEVRFDPQLALYGGGVDGLQLPHATVAYAARTLRAGGKLFLEHHHTQGQALRVIARRYGFIGVTTRTDLTGQPRFLVAQMCTDGPNRGKIEA
ncbi:MAG: HemK/PrmC family methyltransferase [Bowdeniella nasicola]|nr:HemK/PrmC family methyltransferase [Bowdeniella nasicola]